MKTILRTQVFGDWLDGLRDRAGAARIAKRIERLAMGNPGTHRNLKKGVTELKIDVGPGYRVYFTERAGLIVILLCGGDKSSQDDDIALAYVLVDELED